MEKFEVTKENSAKETKKNKNKETKDILEKSSSTQQEKLTGNLEKKNVLEEKQNEELALVQPKIKVEDFENFSKRENIGLLFPLTGADSKIGTSLVNTIRMKISKEDINHTFKVYDTKSSKTGLINAFNNGYYDGVRHFIGPIFSNEAIALKKITESKNVKIFSLSNDKNAVSENIIITGYSIEDELKCLFDNMQLDKIIELLVEISIFYLEQQVKAGAQILQIFESWASVLDGALFEKYIIDPNRFICSEIKKKFPEIPIIFFPKGSAQYYPKIIEKIKMDVISLDLKYPNKVLSLCQKKDIVIQGCLDPIRLVVGGKQLEETTKWILKKFKHNKHIFNLSHGILPQTPIKNVEKVINIVRENGKK